MRQVALELSLALGVILAAGWLLAAPGLDSALAFIAALGALFAIDLRRPQDSVILSTLKHWSPRHRRLSERTYLKYRDKPSVLLNESELIDHLENRYACSAFQLGQRRVPATVLWENPDQLIAPNKVLGDLDSAVPEPLTRSPTLNSHDYKQARAFIKEDYERGPVKYEGLDYRMTRIDVSGFPRVDGAFGWYYDNILTQYAMEWELTRALRQETGSADRLRSLQLPLREAIEKGRNPLVDGGGRCTAITVSTLLVFQRENDYWYLLRRRSAAVGVSAGLLHVIPAGMFEAPNPHDRWSVEMNVWRELLEEVYNEKEQHGSGRAELPDPIKNKEPIKTLLRLLKDGKAEFIVTGICCDLLNLRPEICTVLFVKSSEFCEVRKMEINWEYESEGPSGKFARPWKTIDEVIDEEQDYFVASGAVCLGLGRQWIRKRHGL
jgi:hypothetical protein